MTDFARMRHKMGLTLKQVSNIFEIPYNTVQNWEYGFTNPPRYTLKLIWEAWQHKKNHLDGSEL